MEDPSRTRVTGFNAEAESQGQRQTWYRITGQVYRGRKNRSDQAKSKKSPIIQRQGDRWNGHHKLDILARESLERCGLRRLVV